MVLQRTGGIEFKTVRGLLASCTQPGFSHVLIEDEHHTYLIEKSRKSARLDHLIGERVEVKGLVEVDLMPEPKIHPIHCGPVGGFQRVI